jgi:hypothetical protein
VSSISETMSIDASLSVEGEVPLIADPRSGLLPFGFSKAHQVVLEDADKRLGAESCWAYRHQHTT